MQSVQRSKLPKLSQLGYVEEVILFYIYDFVSVGHNHDATKSRVCAITAEGLRWDSSYRVIKRMYLNIKAVKYVFLDFCFHYHTGKYH